MNIKGKSVLVTGGAGFIGSHLVKRLIQENAKVSVIDKKPGLHKGVDYYSCNLTDIEKLKLLIRKIKPQIIFHLAAFTSPERNVDSEFVFRNNFQSTINLFKTLNGKFDLFVNTGTCEEYGNGLTPFEESQAPVAVSPYSASKIASTYYCQMLYNVYNLPIVCLRPFLTYGPRQRNTKMLIPATIIAALKNEQLRMTKGEQTRDFVYVTDVVDAYIKAIKSKKAIGEIINIGSGKEYKIKDIVEKIIKLTKSKIKPKIGTIPYRKGETMHFYCSNKKAKKLLNWKPKVNLDDGLKRTIKWYEEKWMKKE